MIRHDEEYYRQRKPQHDLGAINNLKRFLWDPKKKAFLDRTAQEWASVGLFYLCFFGVLFSLTALQMWMTYKYVTAFKKPLYPESRIAMESNHNTRMTSLNLYGPGIALKPNVIPNAKPPLILIDETREIGHLKNYVDAITETLAEYKVDKSTFDAKCNDRVLRHEDTKISCFFDIQDLGKCSKEPFGYTSSPQPCVYIKFNKRFGWVPNFYSHASFLPNDMPKWLQSVVQSSNKFHVWLSCEGESAKDTALLGEIEYLPRPGFPVQYFPFSGQADYLTPMVALRFKNLTVNEVVNIECKTWAGNIDNENRYNLNFRILIKDPQTSDKKT